MMLDEFLSVRDSLGEGGMGYVVRAHHHLLGRDVAVKVLSSTDECPDAHDRFRREARITARITSQYVVQAMDCEAHGSSDPYIVLELVTGSSLASWMEKNGVLSVEHARSLIFQLATALDAVHAAGVVHADVKPANVMVDFRCEPPVAKLIDFGVARSVDEALLETDSRPCGTPERMSPEQITAPREALVYWDVWGLATVAYTILTGHNPFHGDTLIRILHAVTYGKRIPASLLRPELSPLVDAVFERAFATRPEHRPDSPMTFALELAAALDASRLATWPAEEATCDETNDANNEANNEANKTIVHHDAAFAQAA